MTTFRSMIKYATDKQLPIRITMFDSNRNQENILYKDEFNRWSSQNKNVKVVYTLTEEDENVRREQKSRPQDWTGEQGRIDKEIITRHLTGHEIAKAVFYICGPPGMLKTMQKLFQDELQISRDRLKVESFTGY